MILLTQQPGVSGYAPKLEALSSGRLPGKGNDLVGTYRPALLVVGPFLLLPLQ
jgi:hypothetical protein